MDSFTFYSEVLKPRPKTPEEIMLNPDYSILNSQREFAYAKARWADTMQPKMTGSDAELVRILTRNGIDTELVAPRGFVHYEGFWHSAIVMVLVALLKGTRFVTIKNSLTGKDEVVTTRSVLMQQRGPAPKVKKYPEHWDITAAAHVKNVDNTPVDGIYRELTEEMNAILPEDIDLRDFLQFTNFDRQEIISDTNIENQRYFSYVYFTDPTLFTIKYNDGEVQDSRYRPVMELWDMKEEGILHPRTEYIKPLCDMVLRLR
ncbi:MAG: NUDIX domain-containing protein [Proteobacteria bacterium]|nr:NUDIX domain-containing protein [Pseudomonadota bacterium]